MVSDRLSPSTLEYNSTNFPDTFNFLYSLRDGLNEMGNYQE